MQSEMKDPHLEDILGEVRAARNLDFSRYRSNLLARRVMTRVRITKCGNFERYSAYLGAHSEEMDLLMDALTINVTEFFRDEKVFAAIEKKVLPEIFDDKHPAVNIWSCGSSSGEEAYSVLMLIAEYLGSKLKDCSLKITGTDIDSASLAKASEGVYEDFQFRNLTHERRSLIGKYFHDMGNKRYWIREEWPKYMEFKYHDVTSDKPLAHMDMVLCRNMLIYFDRDLQTRALENLWKALRHGGFLVLGMVESIIGPVREKFEEYDRDTRIYVKR